MAMKDYSDEFNAECGPVVGGGWDTLSRPHRPGKDGTPRMGILPSTLTFGPVGPGAIAFAMTAGMIYMRRMRKEQGLPNGPLVLVPWVVVLTAISVAPWAFSHSVDGHRPDDVFKAWSIGFPIGIFLGSFGGILWTVAALRAHFPERYGRR